jgi:hypothetical protein
VQYLHLLALQVEAIQGSGIVLASEQTHAVEASLLRPDRQSDGVSWPSLFSLIEHLDGLGVGVEGIEGSGIEVSSSEGNAVEGAVGGLSEAGYRLACGVCCKGMDDFGGLVWGEMEEESLLGLASVEGGEVCCRGDTGAESIAWGEGIAGLGVSLPEDVYGVVEDLCQSEELGVGGHKFEDIGGNGEGSGAGLWGEMGWEKGENKEGGETA